MLVNRLAGSTLAGQSQGRLLPRWGGQSAFAKVDNSIPIDFNQNYFYQAMGVPMVGFYNARTATASAC